jgi:hypothetical protein
MSKQTSDLADFIAALAKRTGDHEIGWSQAAPSAYCADRDTASGTKRMTIMRAKRRPTAAADNSRRSRAAASMRAPGPDQGLGQGLPEADFRFLVEVVEGTAKRTELTINTRERPELLAVFEGLFAAAKASVDAQSARILQELVG